MDKSFGNSGGRSDSGFRGSSAASSHGLLDATGWEDSSGYSHTTRSDFKMIKKVNISAKYFLVACISYAHSTTRGQWIYRPAATRAMRKWHVMIYDFNYLTKHITYAS